MIGRVALLSLVFLSAAGAVSLADLALAIAVASAASIPGRRARAGDRSSRPRLAWIARPPFLLSVASQLARGSARTLRTIVGPEPGIRAAFGRLSITPVHPEEAEAFAVVVSATPGTVVVELEDGSDFTLHWLDAAEADATRADIEHLRRRAAPSRARGE